MFYLRTLGQLALFRSEEPREPILANAKPLMIPALLATAPHLTATREHLATVLWADSDRSQARRSLRQALFQMSKRADASLIVSDEANETMTIDRELLTVDIWAFDEAIHNESYERAVELYGGPFLSGLERKGGGIEVDQWIEMQNARIMVGLEVAYTKLVSQALADGDTDAAVRHARAYAELNPLNDVAQVTLVRALKGAGEEIEALRAYEAYRTALQTVFEDEPQEDLRESMEGVRGELLKSSAVLPAAPARRRRSSPGLMAEVRRWRIMALASASAAAVLAFVMILAWRDRIAIPAAPLSELEGRLLVLSGEGRPRIEEAQLRGADARLRETNYEPYELPSPRGDLVASAERAADGWNLAVRRAGSGEKRVLTESRGDEMPLSWSPDGRFLLYEHRTLSGDGRSSANRLFIHDLAETGRPFTEHVSRVPMSARWSPDGSRIAFVADVRRQPDVFIADVDGDGVTNVSVHPDWDGDPAWSPEGSRLAFASRRTGTAQIYTVRADGGGLRQVTDIGGDASSPLWISPADVAFVVERAGSRDMWVLHFPTGLQRQLTRRGDLQSIVAGLHGDRRTWIDRVRIHPRPEAVSPGQHVAFRLLVTDGAERRIPVAEHESRWTIDDSTRARVPEAGWVHVLDTGVTRLTASIRGWRADTLVLTSVPLIERGMEPIFLEDWRGGLRGSHWFPIGDPKPYARSRGGPDGGGYFVNNGDAHFHSGAISAGTFRVDQGLTISVFGRIPLTGGPFQQFTVALYPERPASSGEWLDTPPVLEFAIQGGATPGAGEGRIFTASGESSRFPLPERLRDWREYAIQLHPNGVVELIVDGRLYWRSPWRVAGDGERLVRIGLGSQSHETEIAHGRVLVYPALRYGLEGEGARR